MIAPALPLLRPPVLRGCVTGAALVFAGATAAQTFEDMEGKSVVYTYQESIAFPNGNVAHNQWSGTIYTAADGRVFFRHRGSSHFGHNASEFAQSSFDTIGDRDGHGDGRRTNYRWNGSGFSRTWTEKGTQITQAVAIQGMSCEASIDRTNFAGSLASRSGHCRIVLGNALR